jgi:hypothetical protein
MSTLKRHEDYEIANRTRLETYQARLLAPIYGGVSIFLLPESQTDRVSVGSESWSHLRLQASYDSTVNEYRSSRWYGESLQAR